MKRKTLRNKIVSFFYDCLDEWDCPNDLIGLYIFAFHILSHILSFITVLLCIWFQYYRILQVFCIHLLLIFLLYDLNGGCFLTLLEIKLMNIKYTQHDIFFYLFGCQDFTKEEKNKISLHVNHVLIIVFFIILFFSIYCEKKVVCRHS